MKTSKDMCPMSGVKMQHPCPVYKCPANAIHHKSGISCLIQSCEELNFKGLSECLHESPTQFKTTAEGQVKVLSTMVQEMLFCLSHSSQETCPNCGYLRKCTSKSLCRERAITVAAVIQECEKLGTIPLKKSQIWWGISNNCCSYLSPLQQKRLIELVASKDQKRKEYIYEYPKHFGDGPSNF